MLGQNDELAGEQVMVELAHKPKPLPKRLAKRAVLFIDEVSIGEDQAGLRMSQEFLLRALETIGIPDVVLVAESDQVPFTEPNGLFEIPGGTEGRSVRTISTGNETEAANSRTMASV